MAVDLTSINASNGSGEAVRALVTAQRTAGSLVITVDSVANYPQKFILTTGSLDTNGRLTVATMQVAKAHLSGSTIVIDSFAPGFTDKGNVAGDVVILKPNTLWADTVADTINGLASGAAILPTANITLNNLTVNGSLSLNNTNADGWTSLGVAPTLASTNGQDEYVLNIPGDQTSKLQQGQKLRIPRTGTVPTQSSAYVSASSQYASKASPTGLAFTDTFTCEAWVYLDTYGNGFDQSIVSRYDNTNGFVFYITSAGCLKIGGYGSSYKDGISLQGIPVGKWVHVAGTVQMSTGNILLYIEGVPVPVVTAGTATSFAQAGNLQIGRHGTGTTFFNGKISNVRVWNTVRTQQQIRDNANIQLVGNETNLVSYYKLNGDFTDSTTNANTLIAQGGAISTFASNPFNAIEYAIITSKLTYNSGTNQTAVTTYGGGACSIPNITLGTISYSSAKSPYGFPLGKENWSIVNVFPGNSANLVSPTAANTWTPINNLILPVPTGVWKHEASAYIMAYNTSTASTFVVQAQLDTSSPLFNARSQDTWRAPANANYNSTMVRLLTEISNSAMTTYRVYIAFPGGVNGNAYPENGWTHYFTFECKYV